MPKLLLKRLLRNNFLEKNRKYTPALNWLNERIFEVNNRKYATQPYTLYKTVPPTLKKLLAKLYIIDSGNIKGNVCSLSKH